MLQSLFAPSNNNTVKPNTTGFNIPNGWEAINNDSNNVYRSHLGFGRKRENPRYFGGGFTQDQPDIWGDLEQNKLTNQQSDLDFASQFPGQQMIQRKIGDAQYEFGLLDQSGNISNNWTHQFSRENWLDKNMPALTMAAMAAMTGAGLFGQGGALAGAGEGIGAGGLSGMDLAADAALGTGNNITTAGSMLGGGAAAGAGGAVGEIAGSGFQAPAAGSTSGAGLNLSGAAPGSVYGTGSGFGIAPGATGAATGGTGLGAIIGSTIPAGSALAGLGSAAGGLGSVLGQVGTKVGGNIASSIVAKVLGGSSGGVSNLGNLASLFTNYNQYNKMGDLINEIKSIYKPDGEYAKYMENQLARRDAAAGRNSQYGPRLAELMAKLGDSQARSLSDLGEMYETQQGGLNGMVGAGGRLLDGTGLGGLISGGLQSLFGNQGGMLAGEAGTTPSIWDRPAEDIDWEELWGG